jgi:hypothetical protein
MNNGDINNKILGILREYTESVRSELKERWDAWGVEMSQIEKHEVVGALMARQVTLATQLASSPSIWNGHIAPLILRAMVDNYINLAWIFHKDTLNRAKKFIEYGLGQEKLVIEHRKQEMVNQGVKDVDDDPLIKTLEGWINSQRYTFLTTVDIGQWAEMDTRKMADEADCLDFYRYAYTPFSANVHSIWNHVSKYNLRHCKNPLHRLHQIPLDPDLPSDIDYLFRAAKYVEKVFKLFDEKTKRKVKEKSSFEKLSEELDLLGNEIAKEEDIENVSH